MLALGNCSVIVSLSLVVSPSSPPSFSPCSLFCFDVNVRLTSLTNSAYFFAISPILEDCRKVEVRRSKRCATSSIMEASDIVGGSETNNGGGLGAKRGGGLMRDITDDRGEARRGSYGV